jgi:hypothetical protein
MSGYQQKLNFILTNVETFYENSLICNDSLDQFDGKCKEIKNHILMREQINHFLQCINIEIFHDIHVPKVSERKSKLNTIYQTNSDPIILLFRSKTFPLSDSKINEKSINISHPPKST